MNIAIAKKIKKKSSGSAKDRAQALFDHLWAKVKKQKQANDKLQASLAELHGIYQQIILPAEKQLVLPYTQLALKLLDFFTRKSLTQWQRQELGLWIVEIIGIIAGLDHEKGRVLMDQYYQVLANHLDMDVDELHAQMEQDNRFDDFDEIDEFFENFDGTYDKAKKSSADEEIQSDLFADAAENEPEQHLADEEETTESALPEQASDGDKWLKTLFRRTANALHPDKEQDETVKIEKQQLMATLLTARESNDIYTIVSLYREHVDAGELLIEKEVMASLCQQLQQQIYQMEMARYQLMDENPVTSALYDGIYHNNKKTQAKNIDQHLASINDQADDVASIAYSIRNLTDLKEILTYRFEKSRYGDEWPDFY